MKVLLKISLKKECFFCILFEKDINFYLLFKKTKLKKDVFFKDLSFFISSKFWKLFFFLILAFHIFKFCFLFLVYKETKI
jgi:hypothetical protein